MTHDIAIIGAGIAGAGVAAFAAPHARVLLLEAEDTPGYHTTGRSAAFWVPSYGGPGVLPLTLASRAFFDAPPSGFAAAPLLGPRGCLHLAPPGDPQALATLAADFAARDVLVEALDAAAIAARFPYIRPDWGRSALYEADSYDIDVAALHAGFISLARRAGATLVTSAAVETLTRAPDGWHLATRAGDFAARVVVNAAGAWADDVARLAVATPLGLRPLRRTIAVVATDPPLPADAPLVIDAAGSFYFKPDAGRVWVSPHDETPDCARDAAPEELDVAIAVARFESSAIPRVRRVERSWAGLRTFTPDSIPAFGFDPVAPGFFWCAGQGGVGIQTAPAAAALCAALALGRAPALDPSPYDPRRFTPSGSFRAGSAFRA